LNVTVNLKDKKFFTTSNYNILNTVLQSKMYKIDDKIYYAAINNNKREWKIYKKREIRRRIKRRIRRR